MEAAHYWQCGAIQMESHCSLLHRVPLLVEHIDGPGVQVHQTGG